MGWKGVVRTVVAEKRRRERESVRRMKQLVKEQKQIAKLVEHERARLEVQIYENLIEVLTSVHKQEGEKINWEEVYKSAPPQEPIKNTEKEEIARSNLANYKPTILDRILFKKKKKLQYFSKEIEESQRQIETLHKSSMKEYEQRYNDWEQFKKLAERILSGDLSSFVEAINVVNPFNDIRDLGSRLEFSAVNKIHLKASLNVNSEEVIPAESKHLLKSGKVSTKPLPKTKFHELYQDYVCSCVLRVARELFVILPIDMVTVNAIGKLLNTSTGFIDDALILSVAIPQKTISGLNLNMIDPSDSMSNFLHNMSFKKAKGFEKTEEVLFTG